MNASETASAQASLGTKAAASQTMAIAGVTVQDLTFDDALAQVERHLAGAHLLRLAFLNAHCVNLVRRDPAYRRALASFLVLSDGVGMDMAGRLLYGRPFAENLNGTDFVPRLLAALPPGQKVALLGGRPGVAERAAQTLNESVPAHRYVAVADGFFGGDAGLASVLTALEEAKADIVLVAMGVPAQERFILEHLDRRHATVQVGVGALFDFLAGEVPRAPAAIRRVRLEWAFRLTREPKRLWRRYILGNPRFLVGIVADRLRGR